ncbi:MAG TPA: flagellin [Candidatus Hydrogenedentes bacterium]|nr:flagellin [Candidatus Hydrogenedentota bacterium]HPG67730.1 flagellin [Candidatus Hydrogenedentota bacterium]
MGLNINTNLSALTAARQTRQSLLGLNTTLARLGSGLRINTAADDAAGLAIAERFSTRVRQYTQEVNSYQSGINAVQTAEGGLNVQQDAIARMRELAVQAANGTLSDEDRQALNAEAQQLLGQINDVAEDTEFNGQALLNGDAESIDLGTEGGATLNINESTTATLGLNGLDLGTTEGAAQAIEALDTAAERLGQNQASLGAQQNRFDRAINQRELGIENSAAAESAIRDADYARLTMTQARNGILLQTGLAALVQSNLSAQSALSLLRG